MQHRLPAARVVAEPAVGRPLEAAAAALGDKHDEVGEGLPEAQRDHVGARFEHGEVLVGGVAGRHVGQAVGGREAAVGGALRLRLGVEVAEGQHHDVDREGLGAAVEDDPLAAVGRLLDVERSPAVGDDLDAVGQGVEQPAVEPLEVDGLHPAGGERHPVQAPDLGGELRWGQRRQGGRRRPPATTRAATVRAGSAPRSGPRRR